jgi:hypothetical protein
MQKDGKNAAMSKGPCGFEKAGGQRVPTSSGLPQRNVYTSGRASVLQKPIYGTTPKTTISSDANKFAGTRKTHVIGQG